MKYKNRLEAGKNLANILSRRNYKNPIILAMVRGGVPVAYEISNALNIQTHVIVVRKLGAPENPELGVGAIAEEDVKFIDYETVEYLEISSTELAKVIDRERKELQRRVSIYRQNKSLPDLSGKTVILVDDGLATGVTARAAIELVNNYNPNKIVFTSPVCAIETSTYLKTVVDEVICGITAYEMHAIGNYYSDFGEVTDEEVLRYLRQE